LKIDSMHQSKVDTYFLLHQIGAKRMECSIDAGMMKNQVLTNVAIFVIAACTLALAFTA